MLNLLFFKEREIEYGRNWDFFFTPVLFPIIQALLHSVLLHFLVAFVIVVVGLGMKVS